jgi:hypothetical protein
MSKPANYYVIVKRDFTKTKNAFAVQPAFTDRRNALEAMEDYIFGCVAKADGEEYAKRCLIDEAMHMKLIATRLEECGTPCSERSLDFLKASMKERETELKEQGFARKDSGKFDINEGYVLSESRFLRKVGAFPKKHFITRDVDGSTDRLTVWRKYDVEKTVPGRVYGLRTVTETVVEKQFSVEVISVPSGVLFMKHEPVPVTYKAPWYQAFHLPKNMTEEQYIEKERKDLARDVSDCLNETEVFPVLAARFKDEEDVFVYEDAEPIKLPRLRFELSDFVNLPCAVQYNPETIDEVAQVDPVELPVDEKPAETTEVEDTKDNIADEN